MVNGRTIVAAESLTGFEFACGIPGSIGGAMAMNAGAYGGESKDVVTSCTVLTPQGEKLVLSKDELELSYRKSIIAKKGYYVLSATFQLAKGDQQQIDEKIADYTEAEFWYKVYQNKGDATKMNEQLEAMSDAHFRMKDAKFMADDINQKLGLDNCDKLW